MLEVGKLYLCEEYSLLLYPDPETADAARLRAAAASPLSPTGVKIDVVAAAEATYWTRKLGKSVSYTDKNIPLLSLNNKEKYVEVLAGDRKGWIIYQDWLELKEISNENIS